MPSLKPPPGTLVRWDHPQAAGLKLCHLVNEGGGGPYDSARFKAAAVTGSPTWTSTVAGITRNGYGLTAYDVIDPAAQILGSVYPYWFAWGIATSTSTTTQYAGGQTSLSTTTPVALITFHNGATQQVRFFVRDDASASGDASVVDTRTNDGSYHVFAGVARSASSRELWIDGARVATNSSTLGTMTAPAYTLGVSRRTTIQNPLLGSLAWHMAGNGAVPDMAWLAREPYAAFAAPATKRLFLPPAVAFVPPSFDMPPRGPLVAVPY